MVALKRTFLPLAVAMAIVLGAAIPCSAQTPADFSADTKLKVAHLTVMPGDFVNLAAVLTVSGTPVRVPFQTVSFFVNGSYVADGITGVTGWAFVPYLAGPLPATVTATFAGASGYDPSSGTGTISIGKCNVAVGVVPTPIVAYWNSTITIKATLKRADNAQAIDGRILSFVVDGSVIGTEITSMSGTAVKQFTVPVGWTGEKEVSAVFIGDGDPRFNSSGGSFNVNIVPKMASQIKVLSTTATIGTAVQVKAVLLERGSGNRLIGKTLVFSVDGVEVSSATTGPTGWAWVSYVPLTNGPHVVAVAFAEDADNGPSFGTGVITVP